MIINTCKNMFKQEKYLDHYQKGNISFNGKMVKTIYDGYTPLAQHNKNEKYKKQLTGCLLNGHLLTLKKTNQLRTSFPFSKKLFKGKSFLGSFLALGKQPNQPKKGFPCSLFSFL